MVYCRSSKRDNHGSDGGELVKVVRRLVISHQCENEQRYQLFKIRCLVEGGKCSLIIAN